MDTSGSVQAMASLAQNIFYILVTASLILPFSLTPWCSTADSTTTHPQMVCPLERKEGKECRGGNAVHSWSVMNTRSLRRHNDTYMYTRYMAGHDACHQCMLQLDSISQDLITQVALPAPSLEKVQSSEILLEM